MRTSEAAGVTVGEDDPSCRCGRGVDLAYRVESDPDYTPVQTALAVLAAAVVACERSFGRPARSRWQLASALCSGRLLANTNCPYPPLW